MEFVRKLLFGSDPVLSTEIDNDFIWMQDSNGVELPELHLSSEEIESLLSESQSIPDESNSQLNNDVYLALDLDDFNTNNIQKKHNTNAVGSRDDDDVKENLDFFGVMDSLPSQTYPEVSNEINVVNLSDLDSMINSPNMWPLKLPNTNKGNILTCSEAVLYDYNHDYNPQQLEKEFLDYDSKISSILIMKNDGLFYNNNFHGETNPEVISINSSVPSSPINNYEEKYIICISSDDESIINTEPSTFKSNEKELPINRDTIDHSLLKTEKIELICNNLKETSDSFLKYDFEKDLADLDEKEGLENFIKDPYDSDTYDGYNSSDFEFITESDAEFDAPLNQFQHNIIFKVKCDNEAGPSNFKEDDTIKKCVAKMIDVRENHEVPNEEQFLYLFGGPPVPAYPFEGDFKSLYSYHPTPMNIEYEGIGFDMAQQQIVDDDETAKQEAEGVRILILEEYLDENSNIKHSEKP